MPREHHYQTALCWTGNQGKGTLHYQAYSRDHTISIEGKPDLTGSADPAFRGDKSRHNPEELLLSSLSACHMLWYLHLCAQHKIIVLAYEDTAKGSMQETENGSGHFTEATLNPFVTVSEASMLAKAAELHQQAHKLCFIANSVNFPVKHNPTLQLPGVKV